MFNINNNVVVPYTTEQMFILVNDISSYPNFIPGCTDSCILSGNDFKLIAKMDVFKFGVSYSFVTQNCMVKNKRIIVNLIRGPLKSLFGVWKFMYLSQFVTEVECNFSCELQSVLSERIFSSVVKKIVSDIISSFIFRANEIYNK